MGVEIPESRIKEFWRIKRDIEKEPWAVASPASSTHCPLALFGDSCKVKGGSKLVGLFLSCPLWRAKSTRCSRWLLASIEEARFWGSETLDTILAHMTYSLNKLFEGFDGERPLANGMRFTITELKGDWLWHKQCWRFSSTWTGLNVCYLCDAKKTSANSKEVFWNIDGGEWHNYSRADFVAVQLAHRPRMCD